MYYQSQANIIHGKLNIKKSQRITKDLYEKLPDRLKKKFKPQNQPADENAAAFNQVIGDTPEEKAHRQEVEKEDAAKLDPKSNQPDKNAAKPADEKVSAQSIKQPPERKK